MDVAVALLLFSHYWKTYIRRAPAWKVDTQAMLI